MDFPRLVYKSAAEHSVADTKEEFDLLRKEGWFASVPEALAKEHTIADEPIADETIPPTRDEPIADETIPPTRDELEAKAKELNIKFSKKTTDDELSQLIAATLEA